MEIKGENFIKNVQMKQEKEELESRLVELDNTLDDQNQSTFSSYEQNIINEERELDDIMLGSDPISTSAKPSNKQKYIVLGLSLIVLFLFIIVLFRMLSNQSENDSLVEDNIKQDKVLNDDNNIEQQYQNIINEKLDRVDEKKTPSSMDLKNIEKEEQALEIKEQPTDTKKAEQLKEQILKIEQTKKITEKKEVKEVPKPATKKETHSIKELVKKPVVKKETVKKPDAPVKKSTPKTIIAKGFYVQVGSFSKGPNDKYLQKLTKLGYKYALNKANIKGKTYTRVLIGPYESKTKAKNSINAIKKDLSIKSAFIKSL